MYFETLEDLKAFAAAAAPGPSEQMMILVGDKSAHKLGELIDYLNSQNLRFFGGVFPGLLVKKQMKREGFILKLLNPVYCGLVLPHLMRVKLDPETLSNTTGIFLADGLSSKMPDLADTVCRKLGTRVKYIGGGGGFYDLIHRPCIFDNKGTYKDAAYICVIKHDISLAVKHGWKKLEGPFFIKESEENTLIQLDDANAFEVYKHVIEEEEHITLFREDFFTYAKDHPFGIPTEDGSLIVRDPIGLNGNNEIICVADIPQGKDLYVLKGDAETLLDSSKQIASYCASIAPPNYFPVLFDCISRAMFLEERFNEELANIQNQLGFDVYGTLSIGEITSGDSGEMVIHNKSTVLGIIEL